jgi:capsular polysaccharide biosynthesis protein
MFDILLRKTKKNVSNAIGNLLKFLPLSSEKIGSPKGYYKYTLEWLSAYSKYNFSQKYLEVYPRHLIKRLEPKTIDKNVDWRFLEGYLGNTFETPASFIAMIPNGRVCGSKGTIISPDDKLLADVSIDFGLTPDNAEQHYILKKIKLPKLVNTNETIAVLSAAGGTNYFHWMFDVLPRIHLLQSEKIINEVDKFLVNEILYDFQKETLNLIGIPQEKIITTNENFHIKANQLIVPSLPGITGSMPQWACNFLRQEFLLKQTSSFNTRVKRIYISRAKAKHRRVINESELIEFLTKFDFQVYTMENLSVIEQAAIFSAAEVIISPHGAALTNLVFCTPKTKVIELFSPNYINSCYRALSNQVDIDYWYLLGEGKPPSQKMNDHLIAFVEDNIQLNLKSLAQVIEKLYLHK